MKVTKLSLGPHDNNVYVIACTRTGESLVVDASHDAARIAEAAAGTSVRAILLTHGDGDHIDALEDLRARLGAPVGIHAADADRLDAPPDFEILDEQEITAGDVALRA